MAFNSEHYQWLAESGMNGDIDCPLEDVWVVENEELFSNLNIKMLSKLLLMVVDNKPVNLHKVRLSAGH